MNTTHEQQLLRAAKSLRSSLLAVVNHVDSLCDLIEHLAGASLEKPGSDSHYEVPNLLVEPTTYSVSLDGMPCVLGRTRAFQFLSLLAQAPNCYVPTDVLIRELWPRPCCYSTVRSLVCRLRATLNAKGMHELADMIDGGVPNHYGLIARPNRSL